MPIKTQTFRSWATAFWRNVLQNDNHLIGLLICVFASYSWLAFYDGIGAAKLYFPQGIYTLPSLSILNTFFSAVYLTFAAIILLSLRQPLSRYNTALPNLTALLAAFAVYAFVFIPGGELLRFNTVVALILIISGSLIIITSLIFLRQAFSVTPQARFLVTSGPYAWVRHPMYLGNILSILGLTLLIDSVWAVVLFFVCSGLQIGRALYEEQLLQQNLPGYTDYKRRVGRFFPRLRPRQLSTVGPVLFALIFPAIGHSAAVPIVVPASELHGIAEDTSSRDVGRYPIVRIAADDSGWGKKCDSLYKKAMAGTWFSKPEQTDIQKAEGDKEQLSKSIPTCKSFFSLQSTCSRLAESWGMEEMKDIDFIKQVESTAGCTAIVGFDHVCQALKNIARKGIKLTDDRRATMAECANGDLRKQRFNLLRPAM
jgi:protein-S-isoprenylcysteine O-methyltransferase Ste14